MKLGGVLKVFISILLTIFPFRHVVRAESFPLGLASRGSQVELTWPTAISNSAQGLILPEFEVQYTTDLQNWKPLGGKVQGIDGLSAPLLQLSLDQQPAPVFYRVIANLNSQATNETGNGGAQVLGYDSEFSARLKNLGLLSVADFATNSGKLAYLPGISWDPTTAQFWTNFSSPQVHFDWVPLDAGSSGTTNILYNYVLDANELAFFMTNGFLVSGRLGSASFGDAYYRIFNADLPVFITADSVLHAWHQSYQAMLEELETLQISTLLDRVISNMSTQLPLTWQQYGQGPLSNSILDADYFLTVARSLWNTSQVQVASALGKADVDQQVSNALLAINRQAPVQYFPIFGGTRAIDFSQFIVRGHYTYSPRLFRYFRLMMWCGRIDLRLATFDPDKEDDIRQLGSAIILYHLLQQSGQFDNWSQIEQITRTFAGTTDSMTFAQLGDLLTNANILSPADVPDLVTLTNLQTRLLTGELGVQAIQGDLLRSPYSPEQLKLPRSFTFSGQKFVMDSWAFSQIVFDRVLWSPDYGTNIIFGKVIRRKPSCLDVAFSVLGNDQVVPELVVRMTNENGVPFRDGPHLPYQHNLLALRQAIDSQEPSVWTDNIYTAWLGALRALSAPTTDAIYPECMRTKAWAMKTLNTQLASWTQLRHDTLLYTKPSYTSLILCDYPAGYVEPRPEFWQKMKVLSQSTAAAIARLSLSDKIQIYPYVTNDLVVIQSNQLAFLTNFAVQVETLKSISQKELARQPLSIEETEFLKNVIELARSYTNHRQWNGWYPQLFYLNSFRLTDQHPSDFWDALISDVHTDPPDPLFSADPGAVIHEAVGNVNLLLIAIDNGPDRMVYAGPVLSHYELEVPGVNRLTDDNWKATILSDQTPPPPEWTKSYLVPASIPIPPGNR